MPSRNTIGNRETFVSLARKLRRSVTSLRKWTRQIDGYKGAADYNPGRYLPESLIPKLVEESGKRGRRKHKRTRVYAGELLLPEHGAGRLPIVGQDDETEESEPDPPVPAVFERVSIVATADASALAALREISVREYINQAIDEKVARDKARLLG